MIKKNSNICIIGVQKGVEKLNEVEVILETIDTENFPKKTQEIKPQIKKKNS